MSSPDAVSATTTTEVQVVVIGGGQAGLAAGYYLRRTGMDFVILDDQTHPGGSWQDYWPSLRLFSPAEYSRLPGWPMPPWSDGFPPASHVVDYLAAYEKKYDLPVQRPVRVQAVHRRDDRRYRVVTDDRTIVADAVVNATGTWSRPFWPSYPGMRDFTGIQLHASSYRTPEPFRDLRVAVVGGGNSAAQILAEISVVAEALWFTTRVPRFLPDDVDGRVLFDVASERARALANGAADSGGVAGLGDVVMVPPVKEARDRGVLHSRRMFAKLVPDGVSGGGATENVDAIVWCTGFRPALRHLQSPHDEPTMVFLGYGDWTGPASATLIGVGRTARAAVSSLVETLS